VVADPQIQRPLARATGCIASVLVELSVRLRQVDEILAQLPERQGR
jgi:hypothetical protein